MKYVDVLGTMYQVIESNESIEPRLGNVSGFCDQTVAQLVIHDMTNPSPMAKSDLEKFKRKVTRHELIHAFLYESGLADSSEWATNEEMVDWFAYQFPKLMKAMQLLECT